MSRASMLAALAALTPITPAVAKDKPMVEHVLGPAPDWPTYKRLAEAEITARMLDPDSAKIHWSGGFYPGGFKPVLEPRAYGYVACGLVNAKNRMGGYTGFSAFLVVIDNGRVLYAGIDGSAHVGMIGDACSKGLEQGLFPPVPADAPSAPGNGSAPPASATTTTTATGLALRAMPEGAYITAVASGSAAATAGLKAGMVIASVNGIALANMGDAAAKVIDAAGLSATLTFVDGKSVKLGAVR